MESLTPQTIELLEMGRPFARALILSHQGSTPRTPGSAMLVTQDGEIFGTIGGGKLEGLAMEACRELIPTGKSRIQTFDLGLAPGQNSAPLAQDLDMICGGSLTLLMEIIQPNTEMNTLYRDRLEMEKQGMGGHWLSKLRGCSQGDFTLETRRIAQGDIPSDLTPELTAALAQCTGPTLARKGLEEYLIQPIRPLDTLYILGAGHVGLCLYQLAAMADFQVQVVDDRPEFSNGHRFPHAHCHVVPDYSHLENHIGPLGPGSYLVILTRGHRFDQDVLEQILAIQHRQNRPLDYIGMIGSRTKRDRIYANLESQGFSPESLQAVHSPVGLSIGAETPAEIAVSIMAEIIQVRAGQ
ncbi:MAG: XdhC family protein [Desulfobacterales bacterium]|nr:XdhC family protein [Desulfobacterales bacterium]